VFKAIDREDGETGFEDLLIFNCILLSKPSDWDSALEGIIRRTERMSYYIYEMLNSLMRHYHYDVVKTKDKERIKRLVATIQTKRNVKKEVPRVDAVDRILSNMEKENWFSPKRGAPKD
jgi:hypothetical protein